MQARRRVVEQGRVSGWRTAEPRLKGSAEVKRAGVSEDLSEVANGVAADSEKLGGLRQARLGKILLRRYARMVVECLPQPPRTDTQRRRQSGQVQGPPWDSRSLAGERRGRYRRPPRFSRAGGTAQSKKEIDKMVERIIPAMRERGGYFPTCDHHVPEEVTLDNYRHYRKRCIELGG